MAHRTLVVTGLPCIGKTTQLSRLQKVEQLRVYSADRMRHTLLCEAKWIERIRQESGFHFNSFPLRAEEYRQLISSRMLYLSFQRTCAACLKQFIFDQSRADPSVSIDVVEIPAFVLLFLQCQFPIIFCTATMEHHAMCIRLKTRCGSRDARWLAGFYENLYSEICDDAQCNVVVPVSTVCDEIHRWLTCAN